MMLVQIITLVQVISSAKSRGAALVTLTTMGTISMSAVLRMLVVLRMVVALRMSSRRSLRTNPHRPPAMVNHDVDHRGMRGYGGARARAFPLGGQECLNNPLGFVALFRGIGLGWEEQIAGLDEVCCGGNIDVSPRKVPQ